MAKEMDQLTKDSISAEKAGMSYGKWMALNKPRAEEQPAEVDTECTHPCEVCGKPILNEGYAKNRKYCCLDCQSRAHNKKMSELYWRKKAMQCG